MRFGRWAEAPGEHRREGPGPGGGSRVAPRERMSGPDQHCDREGQALGSTWTPALVSPSRQVMFRESLQRMELGGSSSTGAGSTAGSPFPFGFPARVRARHCLPRLSSHSVLGKQTTA
jgi:hypothetical protein